MAASGFSFTKSGKGPKARVSTRVAGKLVRVPEPVREATARVLTGDAAGASWVYTRLAKADRDAIDRWLVETKHPSAYEPGTQEDRFRRIVGELTKKSAALKQVSDLQMQINRVGDQIDASRPVKGYYNARENKRRTARVAELEGQLKTLKAQRDRLNRRARRA